MPFASFNLDKVCKTELRVYNLSYSTFTIGFQIFLNINAFTNKLIIILCFYVNNCFILNNFKHA